MRRFDRSLPGRNRGRFSGWLQILLAAGLIGCWFAGARVSGAQEGPPPDDGLSGGRQWALLIAAEKYIHVRPLRQAQNDLRQISDTLRYRGGYRGEFILEMADGSPEAGLRPTGANIMAELPRWLAKSTAADRLVVYFTGHGFRDDRGRLHLVPVDGDPRDPAKTMVSLEWFRDQLDKCQAGFKLLVIDACHAGSTKGAGDIANVASKDLAVPFEKVSRTLTLASCTGEEKSLEWDEKQQSVFSYWLNQGLRGHADRDGDAEVTVDELYGYVFDNVPYVAEKRFSRKQTPARILGPGALGVAVVIRPKPYTLKGTLADMAEKLATTLQLRELESVGVPEFAVDAKKTELELGADFGLLGRYCATELEGYLLRKSADKFVVVPQESLAAALRTKGLGLKDLRTGNTKDLSVKGQGVPALVLGILRSRAGREVTIQCELRATGQPRKLTIAGGVALLNESEWAMVGRSAPIHPLDRTPEIDSTGRIVRPATTVAIDRLDQKARRSHPLADERFPLRVKIYVGSRERKPVFRGNHMFVPLRKGEVYRIGVENRTDRSVLLRLLVDGLNTHPERPRTKGVTVEPVAGSPRRLAAQRVNLAEAVAWKLEPNKSYVIPGFFSRTGKDGRYNEFKVVDAPEAEAARQEFTDQIGLITAAFYVAVPKGTAAKSLGTALGKQYDLQTGEYRDVEPGNLIVVEHVRYVEPENLEAITP